MMTASVVREATRPAEARGITRDAVRMMVAYRRDLRVVHTHAHDLPQFLDEGDLVVVNTSGTLAAAVDALGEDGTPLVVHLSQQLPAGLWLVELRRPGRSARRKPWFDEPPGRDLRLDRRRRRATSRRASNRRNGLWVATLELDVPVLTYLAVHGRPIRYGYVTRDWPLDVYQNVYAREPGSAEMPSAGRPFTPELVTRLVAKGVGVTPLVLHTGVSSLEANEHPYPEWYRVAPSTASRINQTHADGGRVDRDRHDGGARARNGRRQPPGIVHPGEGWTDLDDHARARRDERRRHAHRLARTRSVTPADARSGRRPPACSTSSYAAAEDEGYLWHEFGDVHLLLP